MSLDLRTWLDVVHSLLPECPAEVLGKLNRALIVEGAKLDPEAARATWGLLPEHIAANNGLGQGPGLEAGAQGAPPVG